MAGGADTGEAAGVAIRRYRAGDGPAPAHIHDRARCDELRRTVGEAAFLPFAETAGPEGLFAGELWVAERDGTVAGFVAVDGEEITWLYVDPDRARRGVGRALVRHAIAQAGEPLEVWVLAGNTPALALYQAEGFAVAETRSGRLAGNERFPATGHRLVRRAGA